MSAVLYPSFVDAAMNKDLEKLVELSRSSISSLDIQKPREILDWFGIDLIYSKIPYEASIVVNDSLADLQVSILINSRERSEIEELFLIYHMLAHFLLDVQTKLLDGSTQTFAIIEHESPLTDRYYKQIKKNDEYSKDLFASYFLLAESKLKEYSSMSVEDISKITGLDTEFIKFRLNPYYSFIKENFSSRQDSSSTRSSKDDQEIIKQGFTKTLASNSYKQSKNSIKEEAKNTNTDESDLKNKSNFNLDPSTSVGLQMLRNLAGKISSKKPLTKKERQTKIS